MMLHNIEMPKLEADRLRSLSTFASTQKTQTELEEARPLAPNFDVLDLELDPFMQKNLQYLLDCADVQQQEQNNYQYWQRSVAREQGKMQAWLAKRVSFFFQFSCIMYIYKLTILLETRERTTH
jgi:translation initiation factor 3 subunit H